jgi:hypothetical protein
MLRPFKGRADDIDIRLRPALSVASFASVPNYELQQNMPVIQPSRDTPPPADDAVEKEKESRHEEL